MVLSWIGDAMARLSNGAKLAFGNVAKTNSGRQVSTRRRQRSWWPSKIPTLSDPVSIKIMRSIPPSLVAM